MATAANLAGPTRLTPALLGMVHKAVVAKCDANDGLKDGLIGNPQACSFKPAALICKAGQTDGCLNADQVEGAPGLLRRRDRQERQEDPARLAGRLRDAARRR